MSKGYNILSGRSVCGIVFFGVALFLGLDPLHRSVISGFPDFKTYSIDQPAAWSELQFGYDKQNRLQAAEIKFVNELAGPECLAFDLQGRGPYTGTGDGRIMRWDGPEMGWSEFAHTSPNRTLEICKPQIPPKANVEYEHICGRPLGLRFNKRTGYLYIADAYFGLLMVGPEGGLATPLTTEAGGAPLTFTNDLDIDEDDNVYFTDSSLRYQRKNFLQAVFSSESSGRVLKYDSRTKETQVLVEGLHFPNGLTLTKNQSFFIYASCAGRYKQQLLSAIFANGNKDGLSQLKDNK